MKKWGLYIVVAILGVIFTVMGMFNSEQVGFDYILGKTTLPLIAVMMLSFLFGALLTMSVFGVKAMYWKSRARTFEAQLAYEYDKMDKAQIQAEFEKSRQA